MFLPLGVRGDEGRLAPATLAVAAGCGLAFACQSCLDESAVLPLLFDPRAPTPWTSLSSAFLHADTWHLVGNMIFLLAFGPFVERTVGAARFLLLYLLSALGGDLAYLVVSHAVGVPVPSLGASGAISGIIGATLVLAPWAEIRIVLPWLWTYLLVRRTGGESWTLAISVWWWFAIWIGMQFRDVLLSEFFGAGWAAHAGGTLAGAALIALAVWSAPAASWFHVDLPPRRDTEAEEQTRNKLWVHGEIARWKARQDQAELRRPRRPPASRPPRSGEG